MADGQESSVRATSGSVTTDSAGSAVNGKAVAASSGDSAGSLVVAGPPTASAPPGDGNVQVNTSNDKVQVNLDGSGKVQTEL